MTQPVHNTVHADSTGNVIQVGSVSGDFHVHNQRTGVTVLPRTLPARPRWLVGREREVAVLDEALKHDDANHSPVMTIEGAAGVGKTTLALHWLHENARRFGDGQLYADLRGFDPSGPPMTPTVVAHGFLLALGIAPDAIPNTHDAVLGLYRSLLVDRRSAILLDNALDTTQVEPLLPGTSHCTVIVTSRNHLSGLHLRGAVPVRLDVLRHDGARALLSRYLGERVCEQDPTSVQAVLDWCDGLPLALAIVAARSSAHPDFPISGLIEEFHEAAGGLDVFDAGENSTNLRAVLASSYQALTAPVARLFRLMTLVPAPEVGVRALAGLAGLPVRTTSTLVEELERTNLVRQNQPRRFHMHGLVRLFAAEVAERTDTAAERDAAVRRLVDHYAWTASAADQALYLHRAPAQWPSPAPGCVPQDFADEAAALDWFDVEHQHVLAVQELALELGRHDRVWQLARALDTVQYRRGHLHDNVRTSTLGVTAAEVLGQRERVMAYRQLGRAHTRGGDLDNAERRLRQALDLCADDPHGQAHTLHDLARSRSRAGDHAGALEHSTKALELYRAVRDSVGEAHVLNAMGYHLADLGDFAGARSRCQAAVSAQERLGNASGLVAALDNLGSIELRGGRAAEAIEPLERALVMCGELRNTYFEARVAENLGLAYAGTGQRERAQDALRSALDLYEAQYRAADTARVREGLAED